MTSVVNVKRLESGESPIRVLDELTATVGMLDGLTPGALVLIKPNYVAPFPIATTDNALLGFFIDAVRRAGGVPVVGEMSGFEFDTESTLKILNIRPFLEKKGVVFVNFEKAAYRTVALGGDLPDVEVAEIAIQAELIINLPVLKGHTITKITGATKNLFGLLSRASRRRLHCRGLHKGIAALACAFPNSFHVVDARQLLTRAVFGESRPLNYILGGTDSFALDHFGCRLLGVNPSSVAHLRNASNYIVDGPHPEWIPMSDKASAKERVHRLMYSCFYYLDEVKSRILGGSSLIPELHWLLGVHPNVSNVPAHRLEEVAGLCPVDAISLENRHVVKARCMTVRCLQCYIHDPTGKVALKGLNPPRKMKVP